MNSKLLATFIFFVALELSPAQAIEDKLNIEGINSLIENRWTEDEPGGGVVILKNGKVILETYKGLRNLETSQPIKSDTIFPYASITKRITATTILSLFEKNKIDLDASINSYLTEIKGPIGQITVRELLTHSSGIPRNFERAFDQEYSTKDHLEYISALTLDFEPGTKSSYSNNGYDLLGAIIERITGQPWYTANQNMVIKPTGATSIKYLQYYLDHNTKLANGYWTRMTNYPLAAVKTPSFLHANGGMAGTLSDLAHWVHKFHKGDIVTDDTLQMSYKKRQTANGNQIWAISLAVFDHKEEKIISHAGGTNGVNTMSLYLPNRDIVVVTGTNVPQDAEHLAMSIVDCLIGEICRSFKAIKIPQDTLDTIVGTYVYEDGKKEKLSINSGELFMQFENQRPLWVQYAGSDTYFIRRSRHWFTINENKDGKMLFSFHEKGDPVANIAIKE